MADLRTDEAATRVARELGRAEGAGSSSLALGGLRLRAFPPALAQAASLTAPGGLATRLRRLDLSNNSIATLPSSIGLLVNLRELWLQNNPLDAIPTDISSCAKLETLDIRRTRVSDIPPIISTMKCLVTLDWGGTPFADRAREHFRVELHDLASLRATLRLVFDRQKLDADLSEFLLSQHFAQETDDPRNIETILSFAKLLSEEFEDNDEFRLFVRRVDKLIPERLDGISSTTLHDAKVKFRVLSNETKRKRLSADVEIKIKSIYFDRIDRAAVDKLVASIYDNISSLEDMEFLIKYMTEIMPAAPESVDGLVVKKNLLALQADLTEKRESAIRNMAMAMYPMYPEQLPEAVDARARDVAAAFQRDRFATKRELNVLSQVAAEASRIFPPDFASIDPAMCESRAKQIFSRRR